MSILIFMDGINKTRFNDYRTHINEHWCFYGILKSCNFKNKSFWCFLINVYQYAFMRL